MKKISLGVIWLLLNLWPFLSFALAKDQQQIAQVFTDYLHHNAQQHITVLKGHVRINQGSTHLQADQIFVYRNSKNVTTKIVAIGHPARYTTVPDGKQAPLFASAKTITFYPIQHEILLQGDGVLTQAGNSIHGPYIRYNTQKQILISDNAKRKTQTLVIIQPEHTAK